MRKEELCNKCVEGICDIHSGSEMAETQKKYARLQVAENRRAKQRKGRNGKGNGKAGGKPVKLRRPPAHLR